MTLGEQIRRHAQAFAAIIALVAVAAGVGTYIVAHERLTLPSWVPLVGQSYFTLNGQFETAQAVTPGQGQSVTVAGVKIGEISSVSLVNGRAVVTMHLQPRYSTVYRDATMLLRPKTQLKDMTVELNPGTQRAGRLRSGATVPVSQTQPDVNFDEILASLDGDSRAYLQTLLGDAGTGLRGLGPQLSSDLRRFDPTARDLETVTHLLGQRRQSLTRVIHNFSLLATAIGQKDNQLAGLIQSSNGVFSALANQQASLRSAIALLPGSLRQTQTALGKLTTSAALLGPTLHRLQPAARALGPSERATRPFLRTSKPIIASQLRPFARAAQPALSQLAPAAASLSVSTPKLATAFGVINEVFNELAYNPGSKEAGFLFYLVWANHNLDSVLATQDANGALRHGLLLFSCPALAILKGAADINPTVRLELGLLNPPTGCPGS
jgi:phospholipid/cholesterol/gamma-HCH transport system substrate-binding protein